MIRVRHLHYRYPEGTREALSGISLTVNPGEVLLLSVLC
ncbi:hypothetical protein TDIS_1861 [Thermosulfurimonas dismutans]|uniref:Uncharacterized protein n=1 Tax=Thermosulfurimonas dismutans TaxID=999894 RepID=A0A179D3J4_9BACT|nr:hypothetical protein TDIS_1861 [Thermosulfurimonas dismutans]